MGKRVLIADNKLHLVKILEERLHKLGHEVITAGSGKEALHLLNVNNVPGLIVMDTGLPDGDALKICAEIKSEKRLRKTPILIIKDSQVSEKQYKELGISEFMTRPCDVRDIMEKIDALLRFGGSQAVARKKGMSASKIAAIMIVIGCALLLLLFVFVPLIASTRQEKGAVSVDSILLEKQ